MGNLLFLKLMDFDRGVSAEGSVIGSAFGSAVYILRGGKS